LFDLVGFGLPFVSFILLQIDPRISRPWRFENVVTTLLTWVAKVLLANPHQKGKPYIRFISLQLNVFSQALKRFRPTDVGASDHTIETLGLRANAFPSFSTD
jgi:hypothetical protein